MLHRWQNEGALVGPIYRHPRVIFILFHSSIHLSSSHTFKYCTLCVLTEFNKIHDDDDDDDDDRPYLGCHSHAAYTGQCVYIRRVRRLFLCGWAWGTFASTVTFGTARNRPSVLKNCSSLPRVQSWGQWWSTILPLNHIAHSTHSNILPVAVAFDL